MAAAGVSGPAGGLPHGEAIQRSFGGHDLGGVQAHVGGEAALAARGLGAAAFATGDHVAFRDQPDLHTAAHEAAHVIQQRGGVQLNDGLGSAGDVYERHADAVADQVVRGESAEELLDQMAAPRTGNDAVVASPATGASTQLRPVQFHGDDTAATAAAGRDFAIHSSADQVVAKGAIITYTVKEPEVAGGRRRYEWSVENDPAAQEKAGPRRPYEPRVAGRGPNAPSWTLQAGMVGAHRIRCRVVADGSVVADLVYVQTVVEPGKPVKGEDFTFRSREDDFVVSFELLPSGGDTRDAESPARPGEVRMIIQPVNWSRLYSREKKHWDVRGREVGADDSWVSTGSHSVPAVPFVKKVAIPDRTKFQGRPLESRSSAGNQLLSYDLDGDGRPNLTIRCQSAVSDTLRTHDFTVNDGTKTDEFDFHYIQDDASRHGYSGNQSPRREKDDLFDVMSGAIDVAVGAIPIVGEIVDLAEAVVGKTKWGEDLTAGERIVTALAVLIPIAGGAVLRKVFKGGVTLAELATRMGRSEDDLVAALKAIHAQDVNQAEIDAMVASVRAGRKLGKKEIEQVTRRVHEIDAKNRAFRAEAKAKAQAEKLLAEQEKLARQKAAQEAAQQAAEKAAKEKSDAIAKLAAKSSEATAQSFGRLDGSAIEKFAQLHKKAIERFAQLDPDALAKFGGLPAEALLKFRNLELDALKKFGGLEAAHLGKFASRFDAKGLRALSKMQLPEFVTPRTTAAALDSEGGHTFAKHGAHTTPDQHKRRLETGEAPDGTMGDVPSSSSQFASDAMQVAAAREADAKLIDEALSAGGTKFKKEVTVTVSVPDSGISYKLDGKNLVATKISTVKAIYRMEPGPSGDRYVLWTMYPAQ